MNKVKALALWRISAQPLVRENIDIMSRDDLLKLVKFRQSIVGMFMRRG